MTFNELGLSASTLSAIDRAGYKTPTPIQAQAIPPALAGHDVIGCAATGTGKTAAFVLPLLERLKADVRGTQVLVLAPTRELAVQIHEQVEKLKGARRLRSVVVIGGVGMGLQAQGLREGREVVIATPGRLIDHLNEGTANLSNVQALVLDEADRMLDMGFKPQLTRILAKLPKTRQTLLFSATMAGEVADFARAHLKNPTKVEISRSGATAERADQRLYFATQHEKLPLLLTLLSENEDSTLVFTRTKHRSDKVCRQLQRAGHKADRLHANRTQGQRKNALQGFKDGNFRILVATDIAARGIDVEEIGHVVIYDLPHVPADYVHRVGRTARASKSGTASTFCSPEEKPLLKDIEKLLGHLIARKELPSTNPIFVKELSQVAERQSDPGPPQRSHGQRQNSGRPPGRHARTHGRR